MNPKNLTIAVSCVLISSCASIVSTSQYPVKIDSSVSGVTVSIKDKYGAEVRKVTTPAIVTLSSGGGWKSASYMFDFEKEGYEPITESIAANINGWYWGNLVFGGFIGMLLIDPATGAMWKLNDHVSANMYEDRNYTKPITATNPPIKPITPPLIPVQKDFSSTMLSTQDIPNKNTLLGGTYKWGMTANQIVEASNGEVSILNSGKQIARGRFSTGKFEFIAVFQSENNSTLDSVYLSLTNPNGFIFNQLWDALSAKYGNGEIINSNVQPDSGLNSDMEVTTRTIRWKTNAETISLHQLILPLGAGMDIDVIYKKTDSDLKL